METVSTNFPRDASLFLLSFQEGAPLPMPFPAVWRSPVSPAPAGSLGPRPHSPVSVYHPLLGLSGSMGRGLSPHQPSSASRPARIPGEAGGKAAPNPRRSGRRRTQPGRRPHGTQGAPGCADLSIYLPRRLLPPRPGNPGLYLRRRRVGGVCVSSSPRRAFPERRGLCPPAGVGAPPPPLFFAPRTQPEVPRPAPDSAPGSPARRLAKGEDGRWAPAPRAPRAQGARSSGGVGGDPQSAG